jgi:hypothetical protein
MDNVTIIILHIIDHSVLYLKHDVSENGLSLSSGGAYSVSVKTVTESSLRIVVF